MTGCPQMLSIIKKYDTWDTLAIWPPFGLLDFAVEFEEGVANLFGTSYLRSHYCERGPLRQNMKTAILEHYDQARRTAWPLSFIYGMCKVMEYTHIYLYTYTCMCTLFICIYLLRWYKLHLCLILWLQQRKKDVKSIMTVTCDLNHSWKIQVNAVILIMPRNTHVPWSKVAILGMAIPPLIGILIMGI